MPLFWTRKSFDDYWSTTSQGTSIPPALPSALVLREGQAILKDAHRLYHLLSFLLWLATPPLTIGSFPSINIVYRRSSPQLILSHQWFKLTRDIIIIYTSRCIGICWAYLATFSLSLASGLSYLEQGLRIVKEVNPVSKDGGIRTSQVSNPSFSPVIGFLLEIGRLGKIA